MYLTKYKYVVYSISKGSVSFASSFANFLSKADVHQSQHIKKEKAIIISLHSSKKLLKKGFSIWKLRKINSTYQSSI